MPDKIDYVMVNVSQMERSVAFYRDALGFTLKFASPGWSEFLTGGTTLALHLAAPAPTRGSSDLGSTAGTCSIGLSVADLDQLVATLQSRGAPFVMPPADRPDEGIRLAVCMDPDGLPISFAQQIAR
jgi:lactoylglutathione lyase